MEEISITRALAELKTLDSRISKKISESEFLFFIDKRARSYTNQETLVQNSKSNLQSIHDLINRRNRIKSAIILSNATTRVRLGSQEMTVAEVIERKSLIIYYQQLLQKIKQNREQVMNMVDRHNMNMELSLQKLLETQLGSGKNTSVKSDSEGMEVFTKSYRETNRAEMVDGINSEARIKELEEILDNLTNESNFVLSESNAITKIRV